MTKAIHIIEVGPRDGFQSLETQTPTKRKLQVIESLLGAGIRHLEFSSFVSPRAVPQLADALQLAEYLLSKYPETDLFALVPNLRGARRAWEAGVKRFSFVISLSESHNMVNVRCSREQSLEMLHGVREELPGLRLELEIPTAFGCPFEGKFSDSSRLLDFLDRIPPGTIDSVCLCDTIGIADPNQVERFLCALRANFPKLGIAVHFHDTRGIGIANCLSAIRCGVREIQTSFGGLGGCPHTPGAAGNVSTEDLVWVLHELGYETGIDQEKLTHIAAMFRAEYQGNYSGHQVLMFQRQD